MGAAQRTSPRWLFGPATDLLLGYGAAYLISVPLLVWASLRGLGTPAEWVTPALALLISIPHYGATLLRVYQRREDRRRYGLFAVWITLALAALFVASFWVGLLGSLLVTIYVTWSPWHFSGQNYGLFLMYLRRGGHDPTAIKRPLHLSFLLSAAVAILAMHVAAGAGSFAPGSRDASETFRILRAGIPTGLAFGAAAAAGAGWLVCMGLVLARLRGRLRRGDLGPLGVLVGMQALWYLPSIAALTGLFDPGRAGFAFTAIWIAVAHAVQYLWVTYYYARREQREASLVAFYGKAMLAGSVMLSPMLFLAPGVVGSAIPSAAGVGVLTIAVLNIHHFILDGAIWKLRDGRVARILLRPDTPPEAAPIEPGPRWGLRPAGLLVWGIALVSLLAQVELVRLFFAATRDTVEAEALERTAATLAWFGQDSPSLWARVGRDLEQAGAPERALAAYRRSLRFGGPPPAWLANRAAWLLLEGPGRSHPRSLQQAHQLAEYLVNTLGDTRPEGFQTLAAVHERAGRWEQASAAAVEALRVADAQGDAERAAALRTQLARYRERVGGVSPASSRLEPEPGRPARRPVTY